jgi:imidazolonepropionase-like amidohydrolase
MHTINGAEVLGLAHEKGSLEPGKLADLVVLDRDPFAVAIDDLRRIKVESVFLGGRRVLGAE